MLALTRKVSESILLRVPGYEKPVTITIVAVREGSVKLAFDADSDILILREEIDGHSTYSFRPTD